MDKSAHWILLKMPIDIVLPRLDSYVTFLVKVASRIDNCKVCILWENSVIELGDAGLSVGND